MGKKKTIENCVGTVTVSTRIQNGAITTTYQFKAGFAALRSETVAGARRAEPDLPLTHSVFPPRS